MSIEIGHEKLRVYGRALEHVSWMQLVLEKISAIVLDHWERAAESVVENIANGNSRRSRDDRNKYFDVAVGSALECAACLDICCCKEMITKEQMIEGKRILQPIVNMTMGLREADTPYIKEPRELYGTEDSKYFFAHESLDAYKGSLDLIAWMHGFPSDVAIRSTYAKRLEKSSTSLVLNIAEGNGRFSEAERMRFLDIAHTSAIQVASCLDVLVARGHVTGLQVEEGKRILSKVVPLVLGLRSYFDHPKDNPSSS